MSCEGVLHSLIGESSTLARLTMNSRLDLSFLKGKRFGLCATYSALPLPLSSVRQLVKKARTVLVAPKVLNLISKLCLDLR